MPPISTAILAPVTTIDSDGPQPAGPETRKTRIMETNYKVFGPATSAVAREISKGGEIDDAGVRHSLGIHRNTYLNVLRRLRALGAISYENAPRGRPSATTRRRQVTVHPDSWVWPCMGITPAATESSLQAESEMRS